MAIKNQNTWIPFADTMTALMLIFLLIVVLIFHTIPQEDLVAKRTVGEFEAVFGELYTELQATFSDKRDEWGIRVLEDLSITFENTDILFDRDSAVVKDEFKELLDDFIPTYLAIVGSEKYDGTVKEVKIEGHTAAATPLHNTYIKTIRLSQDRARNILTYILQGTYFKQLPKEQQEKVIFLFSANGFGYGRAVDDQGNFVYNTKRSVSSQSRRVEFKIVTNSDELMQQLIKTNY